MFCRFSHSDLNRFQMSLNVIRLLRPIVVSFQHTLLHVFIPRSVLQSPIRLSRLANSRSIFTSACVCTKFIENENESAFQVVTGNLISNEVSFNDHQNFPFYNEFIHRTPGVMEEESSSMINGLVDEIKSFNFDQLDNLLKFIAFWDVPTDARIFGNFFKIWAAIDEQLVLRLKSEFEVFDDKSLLKILNLTCIYYKLGLARISKYNREVIKLINDKDLPLNKSNLLLLAFNINIQRIADLNLIKKVNSHFSSLFDQMSLDELAVLCLSYFKTQKKLSNYLMNLLVERVKRDTSSANDFSVASICKSLRFTFNRVHCDEIQEISNKFKLVPNLSGPTQIHILLLALQYEIYEPKLLDGVIENICKNIEAFRIKDIERIFQCVATFAHQIEEQKLQFITNRILDNNDDIENFPLSYLSIAYCMSLLEFYPKELIKICFNRKFLDKLQRASKYDYQTRLLILNTALTIERGKEFEELLLTSLEVKKLQKNVMQREVGNLKEKTIKMKINNKIYLTLKNVYSNKIVQNQVLPFKSLPFTLILSDNFDFKNLNSIKEGTFENCKIIVVLSKKDYINNSPQPRGYIQMQNRLLKKLGFSVIVLPWHKTYYYKTSLSLKNYLLSLTEENEENFEKQQNTNSIH